MSEDSSEQFIREISWELDKLQVYLNTSILDVFRPDKCAFAVDEVGITKQGKLQVPVQNLPNSVLGR